MTEEFTFTCAECGVTGDMPYAACRDSKGQHMCVPCVLDSMTEYALSRGWFPGINNEVAKQFNEERCFNTVEYYYEPRLLLNYFNGAWLDFTDG